MPDSRHRLLLHNSFVIQPGGILEMIFGVNITNSDGRLVSVRDIGEVHCLEDYGGRFIPTPQDFLAHTEFQEWMLAGKGAPPDSIANIEQPQLRPTSFRRIPLEPQDTMIDGVTRK